MENGIKYGDILLMIKNEIIETMEDKYEYYKDYSVYVDIEQEFVKRKDLNSNGIYIVISFGSTAVTYGQIVLPVTFKIMSEKNKLEVAQNLLTEFSMKYNLQFNDEKTIMQVLDTPSVSNNFNLVGDGFRSILTMSGTFLISENSNPINTFDYFYLNDKGEEEKFSIDVINYNDTITINLDSQPFTNNNQAFNFSSSRGKYGVFSFVIIVFLQDNPFINKILDIKYIDLDNAPDGVDTEFKLNLIHKNGRGFKNKTFRLMSVSQNQPIAQQPTLTIAFTL